MVRYIVKCMNDKCNNYKMELNEGVEICSLCNQPVTKIETKVNAKLAQKAIMLSIIGFIIIFGGGWAFYMLIGPAAIIIELAGLLAIPVSIVLGIISRSKLAIILSVVLLLVGIGIIVFNQFI